MIGQFLMWIGRQDPAHVFYAFSVFLFVCVAESYRIEISNRQR